jgi:hypothetical protein
MRHKLIYLARRNPQIAPQDWPSAWRSHPRYVSQFPVIGAAVDDLRYCARLRDVAIGDATQDYDGVAIIANDTAGLDGVQMTPDVREKIRADELRVFSAHVEAFSLYGRETLVLGGQAGQAAIVRFVVRRLDVAPADFHARWRERHEMAAARAIAAGKVVRFVLNAIEVQPPPGYPFAGVSETWFASAEAAAGALADLELASLTRDAPSYGADEGSVTLVSEVIYRWPKA